MANFPITQSYPLKQQFLWHIWASSENNQDVREILLTELRSENISLTVGARLLAMNKFNAKERFSVNIVHDDCPLIPISFGKITHAIADDVTHELQVRNHLVDCDVVGRDIFISSHPIPDDLEIGGFAPVETAPSVSHPVENFAPIVPIAPVATSSNQETNSRIQSKPNYQLHSDVLAVIQREMGCMPSNPADYLMDVEEVLDQKIQNLQNEIASLEQLKSEIPSHVGGEVGGDEVGGEYATWIMNQLEEQCVSMGNMTHDRELVHQAVVDFAKWHCVV